MKIEQIYHNLKDLAEKFGITVTEHNFRNTGIQVKSGLCTVKGQQLFIMDKNKSLHAKVDILASCLGEMPIDDIYIVPALREFLDQYKPKKGSNKSTHT